MAAPPSGEIYSGSFITTVRYNCVNRQNIPEEVITNITISWPTMSPNVSATLALSARISTGHGDYASLAMLMGGSDTDIVQFVKKYV